MTQQSNAVSPTNNTIAYYDKLLTSLLLLLPETNHGKHCDDQMANSDDEDGTVMQLLMGGETGKQYN
jgi:hypothetical protein